MINNRQGGRRRGRGGQRNQNLGGPPGGNRQDNRQRGNAAQLLEKYKSMARDAQTGGDRVQMEYYLQYAEHYFRVLNENRARFEEQRRQRGEDGDDDGDDEDIDAADQDSDEDRQDDERPRRQERDRAERAERGRSDRGRRFARDDRSAERSDGGDRVNGSDERIALEALPPAIGREDESEVDAAEDEAPKPRRRTRRPRVQDGEGEIAPAA